MSDDPNRKKSLREQVEEYKRSQRRAEERAAKSSRDPEGSEDDADFDDDEDEDHDWAKDLDPVTAAEEAGKSGARLVKIVSTVFLGVGAVLFLVSGTTFWFTRASVAAEVSVPGVVVNNVVRTHTTRASNSSRETTSDYYHAVVEFPLKDGTKKTVEMAQGNWPKAYDEGEKVTVRYDPQKPLKARLGGGSAMDFFASLLTGFLGFVFTAVAIAVRRAFL
jgi:Protein of unknown function (DUF3592)